MYEDGSKTKIICFLLITSTVKKPFSNIYVKVNEVGKLI